MMDDGKDDDKKGNDGGFGGLSVAVAPRIAEQGQNAHVAMIPEDYGFLRVLRRTNLGLVMLVQHRVHNTLFVAKTSVYSPPRVEDPVREAAILDVMRQEDGTAHPHVVEVIETTLEEGQGWVRFCVIMEFAQNSDLYDTVAGRHERKLRYSHDECRFLFAQMLQTVHYIHRRGFAHLDIKLDNILVFGDDILKLCDFGVAVELEPYSDAERAQAESEGHKLPLVKPMRGRRGTFEYMDPDVYRGGFFDPIKADIFSLGVVFFTVIVGAPPFSVPDDQCANEVLSGRLAGLVRKHWGIMHPTDLDLDLLQCILCPAEQRLSIPDILRHDYFRDNSE
jgi:serine/threonine protein kinase